MFILTVGLILAIVIVLITLPFWRRGETVARLSDPASQEQERIDLEMEKQRILVSISELEDEHAQGRMTAADYQRLKVVDEHRLLKVLDRLDHLTKMGPASIPKMKGQTRQNRVMPWAGSVILGLIVMASASGLYWYVHGRIGLEAQRANAEQQARSARQGMPNPAEMVARLEARLKENPNDLQGQIMAGRSYIALERFEDAKKAWSKVIELDQRNHEAHYNLGLILLQTRDNPDSRLYQEVLAHFDAALINVPREPAVLWYRGVALVHLQRYQEADDSWTIAYQNLSPGSEDAEFVKEALQKLRAGNPPLF